MKREIKFRFWLGHTKKMTYAHSLSEIGKIIPEFTDDIIPLEFIGLHDKNGKEVFEGDVVRVHNMVKSFKNEPEIDWRVFEIQWNVCTWAFNNSVLYMPMSDYDLSTGMPYEIEIIGNIYEHPHLLTHK